jgi:hypothetical protein
MTKYDRAMHVPAVLALLAQLDALVASFKP